MGSMQNFVPCYQFKERLPETEKSRNQSQTDGLTGKKTLSFINFRMQSTSNTKDKWFSSLLWILQQ